MVIWFGCIILKLAYPYGKLYSSFGKFNFSLVTMVVNFRNLQISKIFNTDTSTIILTPPLCRYIYLWGIHSLKNNSLVSRSGYLYGVSQKFPQQTLLFFSKLRVLLRFANFKRVHLLRYFRLFLKRALFSTEKNSSSNNRF